MARKSRRMISRNTPANGVSNSRGDRHGGRRGDSGRGYGGDRDVDRNGGGRDVDRYGGGRDVDRYGGGRDVGRYGGGRRGSYDGGRDGDRDVGRYGGDRDVGRYGGGHDVGRHGGGRDVGRYGGGRRGSYDGDRVGRDGGRGFQGPPPLTEETWQDAAGLLYQQHHPTLKAVQLPKRPGFGSIGEKCLLRANHFLVKASYLDLHHYDVVITPGTSLKKLSRDIINTLVRDYRSRLGNRMLAFDGEKNVYAAGALPFGSSKVFLVKLKDSRGRILEYNVALRLAAKVGFEALRHFLDGRSLYCPQEAIQALDIVLRSTRSLCRFTSVGRSFFSRELGCGSLGKGIEYWGGYYQSIRPTQMGLSLNVDASATAFYAEQPVIDFMEELLFGRRGLTPTTELADRDHSKLKTMLKGLMVKVRHGPPGRKYKVVGLSTKPANKEKFSPVKGGDEKTIAKYFWETYHIKLRYPLLPCLECGRSKQGPALLPMEVCRIVGGKKYAKKLDLKQVTKLLKKTCQRPYERECKIKEMVENTDYNADRLVNREFGLHVNSNLATVEARVLPPPMLNYGGNMSVPPVLGVWNMTKELMHEGGKVQYWRCINFCGSLADKVEDFCKALVDTCSKKGMVFTRDPTHPLWTVHPNVEAVPEKVKNDAVGHPLDLLLIILPDDGSHYGKIKRVCETKLGIVSQCCKPKKVQKYDLHYCEHVAMKINVKVTGQFSFWAGGRNAVLRDAVLRKIPIVTDVSTIVFGADVTHPQPGDDSSPSIAAVVGSMDFPEICKYKCVISVQGHRREIIEHLSKMVSELLESFAKLNRQLPGRIIFYRDGIGEGQFAEVLLREVDAIRMACQKLKDGYLPRVTFIVVQKRHRTRFFPVDANMRDRNGNVLPGTVVDTKICHPSQFDFYLCSHASIQGTNRPTHYHVPFDENYFTADLLQLFTNSLCYTFARCTRSVSVVPPAYYAHLAAFRARFYLRGEGSETGLMRGRGGQMSDPAAIFVMPSNVQEVMFYC